MQDQKCRGKKCRTGECGIENAGLEIAGLENIEPDLEYKISSTSVLCTRNRHQFSTSVGLYVGWSALNIKHYTEKVKLAITHAQMWRRQRRRLRQRPQRHLRPKCAKSAYWFHVTA